MWVAWAAGKDTPEGRAWRVVHRVKGRPRTALWLGVVPESVARAAAKAQSARDGTRARPEAIAPLAALGRFLREWREVRQRSSETVDDYDTTLRPLLAFCASRGPMRAWGLEDFTAYVRSRPDLGPRSIEKRAVFARTFARWARRSGYALGTFADGFVGPRVVRGARAAYSAPEARALLEASLGTRLELAVHLALYAGLSHGDIVRFDPSAVREGWYARPRSKTGVPVLVPVAGALAASIARSPTPDLPSDGKPWGALCDRAGVEPRGGLKRLRHTFATLLDAAGVDSATRRDLMGHTPRSMTDLYTHSDRRRLLGAIRSIERALARRAQADT